MYPASFPGLGRGLDFLLPSFLVSRQEKKVEARWIRPTEYHFKDDECAKHDTFLRYKDLINWERITFLVFIFNGLWKRITFLGYSFHRWNVLGAYAIRPYLGTSKHGAFTAFILNGTLKRSTFFGRQGRGVLHTPIERHPRDGECAKRVHFQGYSFHRWNVCGAYAIRPYRVTGKRIAFLRYNDLIIQKRITFWIFIFDEWWKRGSFSGYIDLVV